MAAMGVAEGVKNTNPLKALGLGALGAVGGLIIGPVMVVQQVFDVGTFRRS